MDLNFATFMNFRVRSRPVVAFSPVSTRRHRFWAAVPTMYMSGHDVLSNVSSRVGAVLAVVARKVSGNPLVSCVDV